MLHHIILIALVCTAVHLVTREGRLMHWVAVLCFSLPEWFKKPLYDCQLCMGGVWGVAGALLLGYRDPVDVALILVGVIGLNGIISMLQSIFDVLQIIAKRFSDS